MSEVDHESLAEYLEAEESELLEEVEGKEGAVNKGSHNNKSRRVAALLRKHDNQKIVQSPHQAEHLLQQDVDVVVHMGCHSIQTPHIVDGTMDILESLGMTTVPLGGFNNCCGILDFQNGDVETAQSVDDNRFRNIEAFDPDYAITECTSCFATSDKLSMGYRDPDGYEFTSMIEFLHDRREQLREMAEVTDPVTIALHDHYDGFDWTPIDEAHMARELFETLPGVEIVEMEHTLEDGLPCNFYSDLSQWEYDDLTEQVYQEAADAGADLLINFWHACHRNMVVYDPHFPLETRNYANFIGERLGFEYRDITKEYKLAARNGKIDAILNDAAPVLEANGISDSEARSIIREDLAPQQDKGC
ncbi:(Fe-S)-binding protein [Haloplanus halobius]|uniref:(Fe-S)-binding protein n=1 Tax=Haloplanus halobius TaxID=2934938 RepID=UPI00200F629A|nr:(Fe-S)-binding protein [Haloplanus sp. XH21]